MFLVALISKIRTSQQTAIQYSQEEFNLLRKYCHNQQENLFIAIESHTRNTTF